MNAHKNLVYKQMYETSLSSAKSYLFLTCEEGNSANEQSDYLAVFSRLILICYEESWLFRSSQHLHLHGY